MSKEVKRYFTDCNRLRVGDKPRDECDVRVVLASDYDALRIERDRMAEALKGIDDAYCNSSPTATDFGIAWDRGMLIGTMKKIARAALQGEQP